MVEHQHGISSFLSFGAKSVQPEILEKLLIGREKVAKMLEKKMKNIAKDGLNHQVIVVGARGTGKTHLLRILYHRAQPFIQNNKIVVAYFAEEEYGISGYLDFMVRILNAFIRWNEKDAKFLNEQLTILHETPFSHQEETIEKIIKTYLDGRPLLILAENFSDILEALKQEGQSKLRAWLYTNERTSIIATAQALSDDIGKEDRPFFGFFEEIHLRPLSFNESYELLKSLATIEKRDDVIEHLQNKGRAQVKAIYRLVKGNHRLLVTFYEFLKADLLSDLSVTFIKTLNDLKPYYETYIRYLQPQQQKILRFIAMAKIPQLGKDIAKQCFIDQKSLSKQLSELRKKKLIEAIVDETDKRNKLYDISEPLLRLSIEIGEHKEGVNALFIDFLALYYENEELESQKSRFSEMMLKCINDSEVRKYQYEIQARERALEIQENLSVNHASDELNKFIENITSLVESKQYGEALTLLTKNEKDYTDNAQYYMLWGGLLSKVFQLNKDESLLNIAIEKYQIANEIEPDNYALHNDWGNTLDIIARSQQNEKLFKTAIEKYQIANEIKPNDDIILTNWGNTLKRLGELKQSESLTKEAIEKYQKAIEIVPNDTDILINLGNAFYSLAEFNNDEKLFKTAIEKFRNIIEINPKEDKAFFNWGITLNRLAELNDDEKLFESAIEKYRNAYEINSNDSDILYNLGEIYLNLAVRRADEKLFDAAIESLQKAHQMNPEDIDVLYNWGRALSSLAKIKKDIELFEKSIQKFKMIIAIDAEYALGAYRIATNYLEIYLNTDDTKYLLKSCIYYFDHLLLIDRGKEINFDIINNSILLFLFTPTFLTIEKCLQLEKIMSETLKSPEEIQISYKYIQTYRKVILQGEKQALYELPKEQREFFEEEILAEHNKS